MTESDIDVDALRKKYSGDRDGLRKEYDDAVQMKKSNVPEHMEGMPSEKGMTPVIMCQACQALGPVKKQYGYRVMDEVCEKCNGEGMIVQKPKLASEELQEKIARVEAMILEADTLEELGRLEKALKERTIKALDAVLETPETTGSEEQGSEPPPLE